MEPDWKVPVSAILKNLDLICVAENQERKENLYYDLSSVLVEEIKQKPKNIHYYWRYGWIRKRLEIITLVGKLSGIERWGRLK